MNKKEIKSESVMYPNMLSGDSIQMGELGIEMVNQLITTYNDRDVKREAKSPFTTII